MRPSLPDEIQRAGMGHRVLISFLLLFATRRVSPSWFPGCRNILREATDPSKAVFSSLFSHWETCPLVGHEWRMCVKKEVSSGFRLPWTVGHQAPWDHLRAFGEVAAQALGTHPSFRNRKLTVTTHSICSLSLPPKLYPIGLQLKFTIQLYTHRLQLNYQTIW